MAELDLQKPRNVEGYKEYYQRLKHTQLAERDRQFYLQYSRKNPLSSKDPIVANRKEREIWRELFYQKFGKTKILKLIEEYIIPCEHVEPELQQVLTDDLLISCIGKHIRRYQKVRATELGGNKFKWYLVKENWKRESANHLIWKFELKRLLGCQIEQHDNDTQGRFDAVLKKNAKTIIIEIVCKRQSIDQAFLNKTELKMQTFVEGKQFLAILTPQRLHKYFRGAEKQFPKLLYLANSKTILSLLDKLVNTPSN